MLSKPFPSSLFHLTSSIEQQLQELEMRAMMEKPGQGRTFGMSLINKRNMQVVSHGIAAERVSENHDELCRRVKERFTNFFYGLLYLYPQLLA
jgi:hypothetical protein